MPESTARVERFGEARSSESQFYRWEVPDKPVSIDLALELVDRLDREVVASFRSVNDRGSEIGGVLLGRIVPGSPALVTVEDYERVPCDYSRGPLYRLGQADKERFDAVLRARAGQQLVVVGMFRSNTRKGLSLDPEEIAFFAERFADPQSVVLLVRPFATKPSVAGIFIRENGSVQGESSYLEFPFSRAELQKRGTARAEAAAGAASPAPPAKTTVRAQVVPIAVRREPPVMAPQVEQKPEPPVQPPVAVAPPEKPAVVEAVVSSPAPPAPVKAAAPAVAVQASPEQPKPAKPAVKPEPAEAPVAPPPAVATAPLPVPTFGSGVRKASGSSHDVEASSPARGGKWIFVAGGSVAAVLLVLVLFFYPGYLVRHGAAPAAAPVGSNSLELRVERTAGQLMLTWNRESDLVKTATKAVLMISDGEQRENVDIDLAQLRNGSVIYSPVTSDVNFRLDVTSSNPALSRSEMVRVLGTRPSAMPPAGGQAAPKSGGATQDAKAKGSGTETPEEANGEDAAEAPARPPRKNLSLAERLRPATAAEVLEPPVLDRAATGAAHPAPGLPIAGAGLTPPLPLAAPVAAPAAPNASAAPQASQQQVKVGGKVQEAKLIKRVEPIYPAIARQARVRGSVEIEATIGKDGKVRAVRAVTGHPLLQQAAADAVRQWVFSPTLLNGTPMEVVTRVSVGFNLVN